MHTIFQNSFSAWSVHLRQRSCKNSFAAGSVHLRQRSYIKTASLPRASTLRQRSYRNSFAAGSSANGVLIKTASLWEASRDGSAVANVVNRKLTNWFGLKEWHDVVHAQCIICHSCITATRLSYLFYLWNFRRRLVRYYWCIYIYIYILFLYINMEVLFNM